MIFATSCYGRAYAPFLAVCLRSLRQSHPDTPVLVTHDGLPRRIVRALDAANPRATFDHRPRNVPSDKHRRIAAKMDFWLDAYERADTDQVCLIDADTIVRGDMSDALSPECDVLITLRPEERIPIYSGVVVARKSEKVAAFMADWRNRTHEICQSPERVTEAVEHYGGPDQDALLSFLGTRRPDIGTYHRQVTIQAEHYHRFNYVGSRPPSDARVIHYHAPWQKFLLRGSGYYARQPESEVREMRDLWLDMLRAEERETGCRIMPLMSRVLTAWRGPRSHITTASSQAAPSG